jgi:hypothetical protein
MLIAQVVIDDFTDLDGKQACDAALGAVRPVGRDLVLQSERPSGAVAIDDEPSFGGRARHQGSCLCRAVRYELGAEPGDFGYCHCTSCRKASGTAHAANAPIERADLRIVQGAAVIREFESSPGKFRAFCSLCGSPLYAYLGSHPGVLRIRLGSLDTPFEQQPRAHTFVSDKAPWHTIADAVPQFAEWADRRILHQRGSRQEYEL